MSNAEWFKYSWVWEKDKGANFGLVKYRPFDVSEDIAVFSRNGHTYNPQMWDAGFISNKSSRLGELVPENNVYGPNGLRPTFRNAMDRYPRNIIRAATPKHNDGANGSLHPTQKPVALCEYLIRTYTNEGETVVDNVMGSGTTMVACVNTGRHGIGIELDAGYYAIAERRVRDAQAQIALPMMEAAS
jgi:site-specific DNA-methyltransferase (adenine-specific)